MAEVMMTSGSSFEGYEIVEYLGFVNVQTVLASNFFKGIAAGVTEMSDAESEKLTSKLEQANEVAIEKLMGVAKRRGADAVIGLALNYSEFANVKTIFTIHNIEYQGKYSFDEEELIIEGLNVKEGIENFLLYLNMILLKYRDNELEERTTYKLIN